jgi:ABC-type lipoprotein export system ATPase subunit
MNYSQGSIWRKWDLHVHTPFTKLGNKYGRTDPDIWNKFCDVIESSDVKVFGITDYFSCDNYSKFIDKFQTKYPKSTKQFFLNVELRLNESVNPPQEEVNTHLLFNHNSLSLVEEFLKKLEIVQTGENETSYYCSDLEKINGFESATVTRKSIETAFKKVFGNKAIRKNHFLVFTAANNDGIRPKRGVKRKEIITDEIDKFSDGFFGGNQNVNHFLNVDRLEDPNIKIRKKPVVAGCDAHSFEEINKFLGKQVKEEIDGKELIVCDIMWVKADPTYEGLKQIIYEPIPGDRIKIGSIKPDAKDSFKTISKICFSNTSDFPGEILFNQNLCTIIGSRSSGKSALLSYIAHSINGEMVEKLIPGPGEGEDYRWDKIDINHIIRWGNNKTNDENNGKIVYIPQNYLFSKSKDSCEIKSRIEPVLFKKFPKFKVYYLKSIYEIDTLNKSIDDLVRDWFELEENTNIIDKDVIDLGDKNSIQTAIIDTNDQIIKLNTEASLGEKELQDYQNINSERLKLKEIYDRYNSELEQLTELTLHENYFKSVEINLMPSIERLPKYLYNKLIINMNKHKSTIVTQANSELNSYKNKLNKCIIRIEGIVSKLREDNNELIEKYLKFEEIETLVKKVAGYKSTIKKINDYKLKINTINERKISIIKDITSYMVKRKQIIVDTDNFLNEEKKNDSSDIIYSIKYGIERLLDTLVSKINMKDLTEYVRKGDFDIKKARIGPKVFLEAMFYDRQRIKKDFDKIQIASEALTLTEEILFCAEMEGDIIGGFSESTMTPGKRALFLLRLILDESDDTWPLLVDQPEDDLDSRSIYDDIVPFIKEKKKERQIIMVTHNANLAIGADSEQIIVANRHGTDRINKDGKQFNYLTGSLEFSKKTVKDSSDTLLSKGICEHACEILDGGESAFEKRKNKYNL